MPSIDSFITTLLEMRLHYQEQIQQSDGRYANRRRHRLIAQAQDGLTHINALLVDETLDNQQFATNLLQIRSHYQATVEEQQRHSANAREQLVHINALLAEQIVVQHGNEQAISMQARAINDNPALGEAVEARELPTADQVESTPAAQEEVVEENQELEPYSEPDQTNSAVIPQSDRIESLTSDGREAFAEHGRRAYRRRHRLEPLLKLEIEETAADRVSLANLSTPLLPQYQHLSKSEAIEKLLQENIGSILHTDYIIRSLYGNLDAEAVKVEKQKLYATLSKGIAKGLWDKVPDQLGCYTIDLKLVDKEVKPGSTKQADKSNTTKSIEVLPAYQHLNLTQAVETVLQENAGQVMNSEKIAQILYGNLSGKDLSKAKDKIGKILWAGARQKRWQGMPGKLGAYTMASTSPKQG